MEVYLEHDLTHLSRGNVSAYRAVILLETYSRIAPRQGDQVAHLDFSVMRQALDNSQLE